MQIALYILLVFFVLYHFASNRKKFVWWILAIGGFPINVFFPTLTFPIAGSTIASGAFLLFLFVLFVIAAISELPTFTKVITKFPLISLLTVFTFASLVWSNSVGKGISMTVKLSLPIFFVSLMIANIKTPKDIFRYEKAIVLCGLLLIGMGILNKASGGYFDTADGKETWSGGFVLSAPTMSPANFSFMLGMAALLCLANYLFTRKAVWVLLYLIFFIGVILAFTRISMAGVIVASFILYGVYKKNKFITTVAPVIAIALSILAVVFIEPVRNRMFYHGATIDFSTLFTDFGSFIGQINTSGRTELWQGVLKYYKNANSIFGSGAGSADFWLRNFSGANAMHCEFLRVYIDLGLIGLALFIFGLIQVLIKSTAKTRNSANTYLHRKYRALAVGGFVFYFITLLTDNSLNYVTGFGIYLYAFISFSLFFTYTNRDFLSGAKSKKITA